MNNIIRITIITTPKARRTGNIGKYGRLKLNYMKKYKIPEYTEMSLSNELKSYLLDIEDECKDMYKIQRHKFVTFEM